jgi:hypothetical protein
MARLKHETVVIGSDGKATTTSKSFNIKVKDSEDFFLTFLGYMKPGLKIKSVRDAHVLTKMCLAMEFNTNKVSLPSSRRKEICLELGIQNSHLSNSIQRLKVLGLLWGEGGVYELSPYAVWKGHTDARDNLLKNEGIELRLKFKSSFDGDEVPLNPLQFGSKEFDK